MEILKKTSIREKGEYLGDAVFAASDGIVTTFAIVAGSAGAALDYKVVLILGFANLFADGFSMASGSYLGAKSALEYDQKEGQNVEDEGSPIKRAIGTFAAFNIAGIIPLLPFLLKLEGSFLASTVSVGFALFIVGFLKSLYTKKNFIQSGVEVFTVGGFAAFVAFAVGFLIERIVG